MNSPAAIESVRRNSAWMLGSRALRTIVAAVYFALLARSLGVNGYGAFVGACSLAGILSPFATIGTGNLLIQEVARDRSAFALRWANCLLLTILSGALFTAIATAVARGVLPHSVPTRLVLMITLSELLFARLLDVSGMAFQAIEQLRMTAWFSLGLSLCRMLAATGLLLLFQHPTPTDWSALYLVSTAVPAGFALWNVSRRIGKPSLRPSICGREILHGLYFAVSQAAQTIYNDIDKTMLARIAGLGPAGIYSAAYRLVDAAFSPVSAVLAATYAKFFQHGAQGIERAAGFGKRVLLRAVTYSIAASSALWLAAPLVSSVLGTQFADSVPALRMLSPLLVLRSVNCFAADSLTGAGHQATRTGLQVFVAALNIGLNLVVLPRYSWRGAVYTSLACDGALALLLWTAVWILCARQRQAAFSPQPVQA